MIFKMNKKEKNTILDRYLKGTYSLNDYLKLGKWFKNDSDFKDVRLLVEEKWENYDNDSSEKIGSEVFDKISSRILLKKESKKPFINLFIKVAAALVIGLLAGYFVSYLQKEAVEQVYFTSRAPKGSISETMLPDGTLIVLNAGSKLEYSLGKNNQVNEVSINGEAWFDVHHNPNRTFVVKTPFYNVNVTGTQFNVKAYDEDEDIATTLVKGRVVITSGDNVALASSQELKPGEQFAYNKISKTGTMREVSTKAYTAWKDNKLIFLNMDLKELILVLERKFGVEIEVQNKEILDLHYTGTIKNESILEIMDLIALTLPIKYEIIGQKIEITLTK